MTRRWHFWAAVVAVLAGLGFGLQFATAPQQRDAVPAVESTITPAASLPAASPTPIVTPIATPVPEPTTATAPAATPTVTRPTGTKATSAPATPTASAATPSETTPSTPSVIPATGPPNGTLGTPARYRKNYDGRYLSWDELIERGRPLPAASASCDQAWRNSGKDGKLDWSAAQHWCLGELNGRAYKPQGVGGSSTATGYTINGQPANQRNLLLITWYSRVKEKARFANSGSESATKMTVIDLEIGRYNTVELVKPGGGSSFDNLDSHGSGVAWAGQYLYTSSLSTLWMYNADDLMLVDGRAVLPAVARWAVSGKGGLSSISVDRSGPSSRLSAINFSAGGPTYAQHFALTESGRLATGAGKRSSGLSLRNLYGGSGSVHSSSTTKVPGAHFQGVARSDSYLFANSSQLSFGGRSGDATVVMKNGRVIKRLRMPKGNVESIYLDQTRRSFVSVTEAGTQFLFTLPMASLITAAER